MKTIVSTAWLHQNLGNPNLVILDASLKTNASGQAFEQFDETLPAAKTFDLKNVFLDKASPFPNTIPTPETFEQECQKLGIRQDSEIVVFDNNGVYASPRVWWLFQVMGHQKIAVLDGGLSQWIQDGFRTEKKQEQTYETGNFKAQYKKELVVGFQQIQENIAQGHFLVLDARSQGRFEGSATEPRPKLKSGKIENSVNLPFQEVLENGKYKSESALKALFENKCKGKKELVFSCGSGLTACIIMLACQIAYADSPKVYDGSWTEWAERNHLKNLK